MAIIYNYPLNSILLAEDMLIGTSTKIVNGQPKNATKNFSIGDLTGFIKQNVSLDDVLQVGNTSLLDAKIGKLYLYDTPVADYGNIALNQNRFSFNTVTHGEVFRAQRDMFSSFSSSGYRGSFEVSNITANRVWDFPDKSGTVALLSDVPVVTIPTLQQVTDAGNETTNSIIVEDNTILIKDNYNTTYFEINGYELIGKNLTTNESYFQLGYDGQMYAFNPPTVSYIQSLQFNTNGVPFQDYAFPSKPAGNYTLATTSDIPASLIGEITIDSYIGSRLQPTNTSSNGFWVNRNVNGAVGYGVVNPNTGNGAVSVIGTGIAGLYSQTTYVAKFGPNYYVPILAGKGGLLGTEEVFVGSTDGNDVSILTGATLASVSRKFTIKADGQLLIQTTPTTGTTSDKLLVRDTSGNVKQINYPTIPTAVTSVTATSPITSSGGTTPVISTSMATNKLIGRSTAGTGVMEEITIGTGLSLTGGTLSSSVTGGIPHATASGTDTYTATVTGVTSYADADAYLIRFTNGNTTSATLNINSLGAIPLYRNNDGVLIGGDIISGGEMLCVYNSTTNRFQVIGTAPNSLLAYVTNDDSVTLTKGMPVYAFGGTGDRMTVKRAFNTSDTTSAQTVGLVLSTSIGVNQKGLIMMQGLLDGLSILPTATWSDGDAVYLGATPGTITNIKPYAPNHLVYLGVVTTSSNGAAGRMYVRVQNGYELQELHNVDALNPDNNDGIFYNSITQLWEHKNVLAVAAERRNANNSTNSSINYCGIAPADSLESASVWTITRLTITLAGAVTTASAINVKWTDRETATYT